MISTALSDRSLLELCCQGEQKAFDLIFTRYFSRLRSYATHYVKDPETAKELVMDVMLRLWERRMDIGIEETLAPYLFRSVKNAIFNHFRKKALETVSLDLEIHDDILLARAADYGFRSRELAAEFQQQVDQLSPQSRLVFTMSRERDMTHAEIADELDLSVNTVKNHMKAALNFFRRNIKKFSELTMVVLVVRLFF